MCLVPLASPCIDRVRPGCRQPDRHIRLSGHRRSCRPRRSPPSPNKGVCPGSTPLADHVDHRDTARRRACGTACRIAGPANIARPDRGPHAAHRSGRVVAAHAGSAGHARRCRLRRTGNRRLRCRSPIWRIWRWPTTRSSPAPPRTIQAAQGNWVQTGLPPNPRLGYVAEEVGAAGHVRQAGRFCRAAIHHRRTN